MTAAFCLQSYENKSERMNGTTASKIKIIVVWRVSNVGLFPFSGTKKKSFSELMNFGYRKNNSLVSFQKPGVKESGFLI